MKQEQITAWALDEASAEERQQLEAALLENPNDQQKADETKAFCNFLLSELRDESMALTDKQRERLVAQASGAAAVKPASRVHSVNGVHAPRPVARTAQTRWRIGVVVRLSLAACAVLGGFWTWQTYSARQEAMRAVAHVDVAEKPSVKVQLAQKPEGKKEARLLTEAPKKTVAHMEPQAAKSLPPAAKPDAVAAASSALALKKNQRVMTPGDVEKLKRIEDQNSYALNFGGKMEMPAVELPVTAARNAELFATAAAAPAPASSAVSLSSGGLTQQSTSAMPLKGGGAVTVAVTMDLPVALGLVPDIIELDGFINMTPPPATSDMLSNRTTAASVDGFMGGLAMVDLTQDPEVTARAAVTPRPLGLGNCLVLRDQGLMQTTANGLPLAPPPSSLSAALGTSLADYRSSVSIGLPFGWEGPLTSPASLIQKAADTGGITIKAGADLTMSALYPERYGLIPTSASQILKAARGHLTLGSEVVTSGSIGPFYTTWFLNPTNTNGLLSFATTSPHSLSLADDTFNMTGTKRPVDLMRDATITTKSGTVATLPVTRELGHPVEFFSAGEEPLLSGWAVTGNNSGAMVLNSAASIAGDSSTTAAKVVTGAPLSLTKADARTLALANANTSTGSSTTFSGTLTPPVAASGAGSIAVAAANTLTGAGESTGRTSGGTTVDNGGTLAFGDAAAQTRISNVAAAAGARLDAAPMPGTATLDLNGVTLSATPPRVSEFIGGSSAASSTFLTEYRERAQEQEQRAKSSAATPELQQKLRSDRHTVGALSLPGGAPQPEMNRQSGANVSTASTTPATPTGALITDSQSDTRYFSIDSMSRITTDAPDLRDFTARRVVETSGESYTRIIENEMKEVAREPLSTLSIDVDTASYANVRRFLNQNMIPPPDAVRIEELVNYFPTAEEGPAHEAKEPFAVRVELAPCPWQPVHRLARIAIKGREMDKDRKANNLVFLIDVSGSMNDPAKLPLVQQSLRMLTEQLGESDRVTIVVYAGSSGVVLPPTNGEKKSEILAAIDRLSAGGSTHGSAGIKLAYEQAVAGFIKGGVNRVILCTDGDFNVGVSSPEELEKLIKHKAKTGVFLSVLGFGSGNLKDRTMETLADKGNGNYAYIDSLSEARKVLVEQMSGTLDTIAKDVKIQVEFNPAAVRSYRLIGYENRLLAKEDFNDDTKDAGEIGAGHSVVALYEVVPANLPPGTESRPAVDSLKYQAPAISPAQLAEAAKSGEMMTVKLRYKAPDSDLSKLIEVPTKDEGKTLTATTDEFKFSAAVAGFGLLLRDSSYQGTLSWETVRRLALDGKGTDKLGYRGEFLQLIDKARGLKEVR